MKLFSPFTSSDSTKKADGTPETTGTPSAEAEGQSAVDKQLPAVTSEEPKKAVEAPTEAASDAKPSTVAEKVEEAVTEFCSPSATAEDAAASEDCAAPADASAGDAAAAVSKDKGSKNLDGESRIAAHQISTVLGVGRSRTREEVEAEYRKLRNDLTNMRRRLNVSHEQLDLARSAVDQHFETLPADFRSTWTSTNAKIAELQDDIDKEIAAVGGADSSPAGGRRQRVARHQRRNPQQHQPQQQAVGKVANQQQQQQQRQRQGRLRGDADADVGAAVDGSGQGKNRRGRGGGMQQQHGHHPMQEQQQQLPQYVGGVALGGMLRHHEADTGGMNKRGGGGRRSVRQNQRGGTAAGGPQRVAASQQQAQPKPGMSASDIALAQKVRDDLRGASTAAEVETAIGNARTAGLTHEVDLGTKKLNKLRASASTGPVADAATALS